ncbi:hypothetical protein TanjilG_13587 [Lupinus angustifolius]|uniref:Exocyst subunit Exo70 family protein n=1 Tax=Lupinus angustifolius TaxID=3871 RepID=A0A1J7GR71_LUPAN|nr:PREDICTED: exocyst complex component EXO70B1-like [Lupinus angustifolius]OIW02950.1 hypothetical protein TanjilG_13587 [Lupinus angustifolius]
MEEKNLDENSSSFTCKQNDNNSGEMPRSPMEDPAETDAKQNDEIEKTVNEGNHAKEKEEVDGVEAPPESESPLPCIEKVSEDIDEFLVSLVEQKEKEATSFGVPGLVERFLDLMEDKIAKYDVEGKAKWGELPEEDASFLESITRISKLMKSLTLQMDSTPPPPSFEGEEIKGTKDSLVNRIGLVQQRMMLYLEEDFRYLLEESRNNPTKLDHGGNQNQNQNHAYHKGKQVVSEQHELNHEKIEESDHDFPGYSNDAILNLNKIAGAMLCGGYQSECSQVYIISRRNALEESLHKLGFEKISIDEMQKVQWETLARDMVPAWINTFKQCASMYFSNERKLAEAVFVEHPNVAAGLFSNLSRGVVIQLLNFAEGAAMTKRAGEKLFKLLDMYETLRDVISKLDELFPEECVKELKTEMTLAKCRLGEATISIFCDLEISIKSETVKTPVPGGAVHPLTRYIMNYLNIAGDYRETLEQVFKEHSKFDHVDSTSSPHHENDDNISGGGGGSNNDDNKDVSPFAAQVTRVMELLDTSLEGKAKLYRDIALSNFFMMNNGRYILQKIKGSSEMARLMGDTWCRKRSSELRTYHKNYQRETWNRVVACLTHEGLNVNGKVQKLVLKERFKSFNALFDEIHRTQSTWVVKDEQLQSELRVSICAVVIPAYRSFLGRFAQYIDPGRQTEKYVKYQAEDIETYIDDLFDGKPHQSIGKRKT